MGSSAGSVALAFALGLGLGAGVVALVSEIREREDVATFEIEPAEVAPQPNVLVPAARVVTEAEPAADSARRVAESRVAEGPISAALRAHAVAEIERGWREVRREGIPAERAGELLGEFERAVQRLPFELGLRAAREQSEGEIRLKGLDLARPDLWLDLLPDDAPELRELARDSGRFAELFVPRAASRAVDGTVLGAGAALEPGSVVQFPAGVFAVADLARGRDPFPTDLTVRGAGMNATLLVLDELGPRSALERFTLEDCTVLTTNCGVVNVRRGASTLLLRRVRITGFDCGAGGSCALYLRATALLAVGCRFEAGYGRSPNGHANLLRQGGAFVARFTGCTFERLDLADAMRPGVVFENCTMTELLSEPREGPLYEACAITVMEPELCRDAEHRTRDLGVLFPGWEARLERR